MLFCVMINKEKTVLIFVLHLQSFKVQRILCTIIHFSYAALIRLLCEIYDEWNGMRQRYIVAVVYCDNKVLLYQFI